jgi:hypothetical protein
MRAERERGGSVACERHAISVQQATFLSTSRALPLLCYGMMAGPRRLYPLHDSRLATPLRKEAWLNRVCSSPCQNGAVSEILHWRLSCLMMFPAPASLIVRASSPVEHPVCSSAISFHVCRVRVGVRAWRFRLRMHVAMCM